MQKNKLFFLVLVLLLGCQTNGVFSKTRLIPSLELPQQNAPSWAKEIDENANLYRVDSLLYRSMQLDKKHLGHLKKEGIDAVLNLRFFYRGSDKKHFEKEGLELISVPLKAWSIKPKHLAKALWEIEKRMKNNESVLVHCKHGADRTGIVIAMYRIIYQGWTTDQAKDEMINGPYEFHSVFGNLPKMLNDETVKEVKKKLQALRNSN